VLGDVSQRKPPRKTPSLTSLPSLAVDGPPGIQLLNHAAQLATWPDPADSNPLRRAARQIRGWRRADPLRACLVRHGTASSISEAHIAAADILRRLYDGTTIGFSTGWLDGLPVTAATHLPRAGPTRTATRQARCAYRLERTLRHFTVAEWKLLFAVVISNVAVSRVAVEWGVGRAGLTAELVGTLDKLAALFASDIEREPLAA
jgi:hypothetical protein